MARGMNGKNGDIYVIPRNACMTVKGKNIARKAPNPKKVMGNDLRSK